MSEREHPVLNLTELTRSPDLASGYGRLREGGATLVRGEKLGGCDYWAVIGYQAVRQAAADTAQLVSSEGVTIPPLNTAIPAVPVEVDPPDHRKYRRFLMPELRPDRIADWADTIRGSVDHAIDQFIEHGEGDLIAIARYVPPVVIAAMLGVPNDAEVMVDLTQRLNQCATRGDDEGRAAVNKELMAYLDKVITAAEGSDRADLLGLIANATIDGEPIGHMKAVAMAITVVIAGQETTVNGIANMLTLLGTLPEVKRQLIDDPSRIPAAVEEALRLESPVQLMGRTAATDLEIDGCPIHAGERVGLGWGAANLDPERFDDPGRFRLDRGASAHVAFGYGVHRCVGEHLARKEMVIATEQVLARIPDFELTGEVQRGTSIAMNRGARSIPVRFTPGTRVSAR